MQHEKPTIDFPMLKVSGSHMGRASNSSFPVGICMCIVVHSFKVLIGRLVTRYPVLSSNISKFQILIGVG